ncbi:TetR/AcrR family transcriptional regulator [Yinghuangia sp. ASG 101]|uniref:TetR/AcrR family transcriptional regulator n=1 Tax=Yinghuangia sp. ASG 101 TaxID=2896848 RepID=UPI001E3F6DFC|nr:TetR/AcrR family transcriptional regulator [Yinghuangia sp. ASG 101]UGQ12309.1 TetR/AcrR family transcriptional regulator [Yinghuangia sp. ASG 101]
MSPARPQSTGTTGARTVARRSDARRNHDRVIAAAAEVFAERGLDGTIPEIAARAGVGKATVYRSYPTKDDLVAAVARDRLTWLADRVGAAGRRDDAYAALHDLLGDISAGLATDRLLADVLPHATRWRQEHDLDGQFDRLIERARNQGRIRPDATARDIRILVGGYSRVLTDLGVRDPAQWRRYASLTLHALRADGRPDD